ncbi:MAG: Fpg/Nei family DNA glycosylase [Microbacteriaceae bacterium]|nr:Fpg/Nei family DNA glycosylase [Microbacteriaceae bacterium]
MPEGHSVQRTANWFNKHLAGTKVKIDSPQGRFTESAKLVSNRKLIRARAIGKQLFLDFENNKTVRVHLGIYGKWRYFDSPKVQSVGQVRARFYNSANLADLRGPTICEVIETDQVVLHEKRLGPDPTNPDPKKLNRDRFVSRVLNSKSAIGLLLMNQSVISGVGNVYRAELLFRAKISPHRLGSSLSQKQAEELWQDAVALMKIGVAKGFMVTREEQLKSSKIHDERNYVYKREGLACLRCKRKVVLEIMATRKLYWCPGCQK